MRPFQTLPMAIAFASAILVTPALAQDMVLATQPEVVAAQMQESGLKAKLGKDDLGDPVINSAAAGVNFDVFFYDCTGGKDCGSVQFSSCFDLKDGLTLEAANTWNYDMRYGKASLNKDMDPCLKMDIDLTSGMDAGTFQHVLVSWDQILGKFVKDIGY